MQRVEGLALELMLEEECLLTVVLENDGGVYKVVEWTHH